MKGIIVILIIVMSAFFFIGCAATAKSPVTGFIFTNVSAPELLGGNAGIYNSGTASAHSILGLAAFGDASIASAMKNGNIKKIHHVDYDCLSIFGIYARYMTTVYGQ